MANRKNGMGDFSAYKATDTEGSALVVEIEISLIGGHSKMFFVEA